MGKESVRERFRELINRCAQCGTCTAACPASDVSDYHIRKIVRRLQLDMETGKEFLEKMPWLCTQCGRCHVLCNEGLEIPELIMALRVLALDEGLGPEVAKQVSEAIRETSSPYKSLTRTKSSWVDDTVKVDPDSETLYWVGCTPSIMSQNIARATAKILDKIGGGFRLLDNEPCCGEPLITLGLVEEAKEVAGRVVEAIKASGAKRIVTSCSGCYNTFKNLYPKKLGMEIPGVEILHVSQLLEKIEGKDLKLKEPVRIVYHDPCSLGRHSGVYDPPRELLKSIEGVELVEMDPTRELSICCGGGGGLWSLNRQMAMEIASRKLEKSLRNVEADAIVTCCPVCYNNFRYTLKKAKSPLKVYELAEIVAMALE
jgi:Fe-S oxidoreductase